MNGNVEEFLKELKKEVVDARNLIIKTDNLVKNLSVDLKQLQKKFENYEHRSILTSIAAYVIFVALIFIGLWAAFNSKLSAVKSEHSNALAQVEELRSKNNALTKQLDQVAWAAGKAQEIFDKLSGPNPQDGLKLMAETDINSLPGFTQKSLRQKEMEVREKLGMEAFETGRKAFNSQRWKDAIAPLSKAMGILPRGQSLASAAYMRGYSNYGLKNWREAAEDFGLLVELAPTDPLADDSQYFRGYCFEQAKDVHNARIEYEKALKQYPGSPYRNTVKTRLQALTRSPQSEGVFQQPQLPAMPAQLQTPSQPQPPAQAQPAEPEAAPAPPEQR